MATNVTVDTWAEAQREYRRLLEVRLAQYLGLWTQQGIKADPDNQKPLNAIMAHVPVHLLEQSKTGVAELTITVKLMRGTEDITKDNLCPTVKVNVDGRSPAPREQLPHIGFSVRADGSGESHVFVRESLPKGTTIRGRLGDESQRYVLGTTVTSRGTGGSDKWHVSAEIRRFDQ